MLPQQPRSTRRSTLSQSRTLFLGRDVHKDPMAVAYGAQEPGAAVLSLGPIGTRQGDSAQLVRQTPAKAQHLLFVYAAGPGGSWLDRYLPIKDYACWVVAPALRPQ